MGRRDPSSLDALMQLSRLHSRHSSMEFHVRNRENRSRAAAVLDTDRGIEVRIDGLANVPTQVIGSRRQSRTDVLLEDLDLDGRLDLVFGDAPGTGVAVCLGKPEDPAGAPGDATAEPQGSEADIDVSERVPESVSDAEPAETQVAANTTPRSVSEAEAGGDGALSSVFTVGIGVGIALVLLFGVTFLVLRPR